MMGTPVASRQEPRSLAALAARTLVQHPAAIGSRGSNYPWETSWRLSRYVMLTPEVADLLLAECRNLRPHNDFVSLLYEQGRPPRVRLQTVDVRGLSLDARQIVRLMADRPRVLRFDAVIEFSAANLAAFRERCGELRQLAAVGRTAPTTLFLDTSLPCEELERRLSADQPLLPCPHLLSFRLVGSAAASFRPGRTYVELLLLGFPALTHLELSNVYSELDAAVVTLTPRLTALVLHNVWLLNVESLSALSELRHLDISTPPGGAGQRAPAPPLPDEALARLVAPLTHLQHLDISGTTLAGSGLHGGACKPPHAGCDIVGLSCRAETPLRFLGIYGCNASHRKHLPAVMVGGDIGADQLLATAAAHRHHLLMMCHVLEQLETLLQITPGVPRWPEILHTALDAMERFYFFKEVHIRCGAIIQNITSRGAARAREAVHEPLEGQRALTEVEKQRILKQLFRSVALHKKSIRIRHFTAIILMNFDVPREMMFAFEGFLDTLGYMLNGVLSERDNFVERVLIFLLNKTCCDVDGKSKVMVGERGLLKILLKAIHARCQDHNCDEVMRFLWSCLWNVTDETPENCQLFLDNRGMRLFTQCLNEFKNDNGELVRNMMGLVGNIAEVPRLRAQFLTKETVETFLRLLSYSTSDLEISYHAAGVLSNMLSDGAARWTLGEPSCGEVMSRLERAVRGWDVTAERSINYRSLRPIIRLLRCDVPESQLWAAWALSSLTQSMPRRYCGMLELEGGVPLLRLVAQPGDDSYLARLARQCLAAVQSAAQAAPLLPC